MFERWSILSSDRANSTIPLKNNDLNVKCKIKTMLIIRTRTIIVRVRHIGALFWRCLILYIRLQFGFRCTPQVIKRLAMIDAKTLDSMVNKISSLLPADLAVLKKDVEDNIRATLQGVFQKLDLVTREEFDVQAELLARMQTRLQELEQRVKSLESE